VILFNTDERISWQFRTRERFRCPSCSIVFSSSSALANHKCSSGNVDSKLLLPSTSRQQEFESFPSLLSKDLFSVTASSRPAYAVSSEVSTAKRVRLSRTRGISSRALTKRKLITGSDKSSDTATSERKRKVSETSFSQSREGRPVKCTKSPIKSTSKVFSVLDRRTEGEVEKESVSVSGSSSIASEIRAQVLQSVHSLSSEVSLSRDFSSQEFDSKGGEESVLAPQSPEEPEEADEEREEQVEEETQEESEPSVCTSCGETGPHSCSLRLFSCPHCKKNFSSRFKLSRHQLIHGGVRQYHCTICDRSFHRKDHLKNHSQIHAPNKQYKCERKDCGKEYNSYMSYRKHCAFHSAEEGDLECKFCTKMFDNKEELLQHLKEHVGTRSVKSPSEKKFQCEQCDRRFFTRKDVKRHLVVHTGTRDFCCSLCPQKFGRKDHLVRHIKKSHGVSDMSRLESLADPLGVPGPSSSGGIRVSPAPPPSPGLSSISTSSGEAPTSYTPYQDVTSFSGFSSDPSDILLGPEPIKEEPELTASVTGK